MHFQPGIYDESSRIISEAVHSVDPNSRYCVTVYNLWRAVLLDTAALIIAKKIERDMEMQKRDG